LLSICVFIIIFIIPIAAEKLPLKAYTSADGLESSAINQVYRDSSGFMWFATRDGLSRFDGREFVNYSLNDANASQSISFVLETRDGSYWIAAGNGLYRLQPREFVDSLPESIKRIRNNRILLEAEKVSDIAFRHLFEDKTGRLWGGATESLFLIADEHGEIKNQKIDLGSSAQLSPRGAFVRAITESIDGSLWIGCETGVVRRAPDGRMINYLIPRFSGTDEVFAVAESDNRIFVAHSAGLFVFRPESLEVIRELTNFAVRKMSLSEKVVTASNSLNLPENTDLVVRFTFDFQKSGNSSKTKPQTLVSDVFKSAEGKLWFAQNGVMFSLNAGNIADWRDENNLSLATSNFAEDLTGNLWIGTGTGAIKFVRRGLTTFNERDNLPEPRIHSIHQNSAGELFVVHGDWRVSRMAKNGFESIRLKMPNDAKSIFASTVAFPDNENNWWALAENGLYRFASLGVAVLPKLYRQPDGLKGETMFAGFEDSRGDLWLSNRRNIESDGLTRFERATNSFRVFGEAENFPTGKAPASFVEDHNGNVWFGFFNGGLARFNRTTNRFQIFTPEIDGVPRGGIYGLHIDRKGRLWIASSREGLNRVDDPAAEKLKFVRYLPEQGLASNNVSCIAEDLFGNIYAGTGRGVNRVSPETGQIKHFSTADGLAADSVTTAFRDRAGAIWFGTPNGLSRLIPEPDQTNYAPRTFIGNLNIAGNTYALSEFGQTEVSKIEVAANENNLQIDFFSIGEADDLRYQYKLENADEEWSTPTFQRSVNFSNLAPGSYKFLVRSVNNFGVFSEQPASVSFAIRPPFYRTWEFITAVILLTAFAVFSLDRYRVAKTRQVQSALTSLQESEKTRREAELALQKSREERLKELERVRSRIATDLHDDIGASLSQIAVLTEVARNTKVEPTAPSNDGNSLQPLDYVAEISTELVASMSDIVWAINPQKDSLRELVYRMRRFASDIFTAKQIRFQFDAPDVADDPQMGANIRREVYVIFKECVNNIVRHSGAKTARVKFEIKADFLRLEISDDGRGFDVSRLISETTQLEMGGNGLINMQRRALDLGGKCQIASKIGVGTTTVLEIPLPKIETSDNATTNTDGEKALKNNLS
jgi:signal transduction histidine kinase/streptogramin lyase